MKSKILSVGHMEFPLGLAQVQRQLLLARSVELEGFKVTVLCRYGIHNANDRIQAEGEYEGIHYIYCSGTSVRPDGYFRRNYLKFRGLFNEIRQYRKSSVNGQLAGVLVSTNRFHNILFYFLLGKLFRVNTVVDNVEYWTSNKKFKGFDRIDKLLYDKYYYYFTDKVICISDYLIEKIKESRRDRILKIPAITDFTKFRKPAGEARLVKDKYFLYCGSDAYSDVIDFVISAFEKLDKDGPVLVLVTRKTERLINRISQIPDGRKVLVMQNVSYSDLVNLYLFSEALLIPLRNIDQDRARFPHKISEYCASCRPIITNKVGEIGNYFDDETAFLCRDYDESAYAEKMAEVIQDPVKAITRSKNSFKLGMEKFNYKSYSEILAKFITGK